MNAGLQTLAMIGHWELVVIVLVVVLLFGSTKIPQLMRGVGQGINEFKAGLKEPPKPVEDDKSKDAPPNG
jgi:sec-independent protein translocase protein TatA